MLYDHTSDPGENENVVAKPPYADDASALSRDLNRVKGRDSE
jgi:hypothetical protein